MPLLGEYDATLIDRRSKASTQRLSGLALTAANIVAQSGLWASLAGDYANVSLGTLTRWSIGNVTQVINPSPPTDDNAIRGSKWAVSFYDATTGFKFTTQIPVAKFAGQPFVAGQDYVDLAQAPFTTYKTDFEAVVKSRAGNAVVITKIRAIGRHTKR